MVKCEWISCIYNSENSEHHYDKRNGICNCNEDIVLKHIDNFDKCEEKLQITGLEGLECQNYKLGGGF